MGDVQQRALGVAEDQQIGLGVRQHRAAHGVRPVVVVAMRRKDASIEPMITGVPGKASRQRWA